MADFSSTSRFRVSLLQGDGTSERVTVQIGLDGLKVLDSSSNRTMRSYELGHISRWQSRPGSLVLYTRTPVDVEERQLTLQGDEHTIRSALDMLTCSCMQLAELLQNKQTSDAQETANSLHALVAGDGKKKTQTKLPSADDVEYWNTPAMEGWLHSQGDHIKSWRKRWFVLKQGYLFRFMNSSVTESTKPRGVVDLSKVQDVSQASKITGKAFSFQLKTATGGSVCYLCENETDLVMWMSAVNREVEKIVKKLAGVEDEPPAHASSSARKSSSAVTSGPTSSHTSAWLKQLEKNFDNLSTSGHKPDRGGTGPAMVDVVGYETLGSGRPQAAGGSNGTGGRSGGYREYDTPARGTDYGTGYGNGIGYDNIAGASGVVGGSGGLSADTLMNYGGAAPGARTGAGASNYSSNAATQGYSASGNYSAPSNTSYGAGGAYATGGGGGYSAGPAGQTNTGGYQYGGMQQQGSGGYAAQPAGAQQYGQQQQGYVQQHQGASLIDQVPQSQPAYPYYQQGMPQASASSQPSQQWQVHHTAEGRPYYYNTSTGTTQWEAPAGLVM